MTEKTIGQQLDGLGLTIDLPEGHRVEEATVHLVTGQKGYAQEIHRPIRLPRREPGSVPVPNPVERRIVTVVAEGQEISSEQRERVQAWLRSNGIDPARVAFGDITVECKMHGDRPGCQVIGFTEFYESPEGHREINVRTLDGALAYQRWVVQTVPIEPDPIWPGWGVRHAEIDAMRAVREECDD